MLSKIRALSLRWQFVCCLTAVAVVAIACYLLQGVLGYRVTALVLLMAVSLLAMLFAMWPVLLAAALSALIWNFFFIPPVFTFHIGSAEDLLLFLMYFAIASVNAVLLRKVRQAEQRVRDREESDRSIALYNTLLNSLSHELRTPIAAVVGSVDALKDPDARLSLEQRAELLSTIEEAGMRLDRQVENLLSMGRLESGMLRPVADWCDVNEVFARVIQALEVERADAIVFEPDPGLPLFKLDGGLLEQVMHNLLHNAIAHTPVGSTVRVSVAHHEGACLIRIADDGPGIPEEERSRAFEKFHRLPNSARGGSGLGLSIVKGFLEAMGGVVTLAANTPRGALFTVRIPAETSYLSNLKHE